jgi:hypothetical protein
LYPIPAFAATFQDEISELNVVAPQKRPYLDETAIVSTVGIGKVAAE